MKPFKPKELVARVRARLRRTEEEPAELLSIADIVIDVSGTQGQPRQRADLAHTTRIRPAGRIGAQAAPGVHP